MKRLLMGFVWLVVFVFLLLVLDQVLLRYPSFEQPFLHDVQRFHADFRRRLLGLPPEQPPPPAKPAPALRPTPRPEVDTPAATHVDALVEREIARVKQQATSTSKGGTGDGSLRYIYLDAEHNIQFAERYEEIPPQFR